MNLNNKSLLFVCTGNTCRSPMAEYLMKSLCARQGIEAKISSRGLDVSTVKISIGKKVHPYVSSEACTVMRELDPVSQIIAHDPRQIYSRDIGTADIVLAMEEVHRDKLIRGLRRRYGKEIAEKIFTLKEYAGFTEFLDISDPMRFYLRFLVRNNFVRGDSAAMKEIYSEFLGVYRTCRNEIKMCLEHILANPEPDIKALLEKQKKGNGFGRAFLDFLFEDF